jgi:hypothetical protein
MADLSQTLRIATFRIAAFRQPSDAGELTAAYGVDVAEQERLDCVSRGA